MKLFAALFLLTAFCFAQDAKIMIVEKSDSKRLAASYREYKEALKRWEDTKSDVAKQYTFEPCAGGNITKGCESKVISGWEKIQFSADFRAIVPDSSQYATRYGACWGSGTVLTNSGAISAVAIGPSDLYVDSTASAGVDGGLVTKERPKQGARPKIIEVAR